MPSNQVTLPTVIKDVTLMSPGTWNGWDYSSEELAKAFESTDWGNHEVTNLFLDHPQNAHNAAGQWAGRILNQKLLEDGTVKGDLEIWDEQTVINLTLAKAKFGVSPRVIGKENEDSNTFTDFVFDNFSIVSKPAQSTASINLNSNEIFGDLVVKQLNKDNYTPNNSNDEIKNKIISLAKSYNLDVKELSDEALLEKKKKYLKGGMKKKEMTKEEVKNEEENSEETSEDKSEESKEEVEEKELSDAQVLSIMNDNYNDFNLYANGLRENNPSISLKELAKGFSEHKKKLAMVEELSSSEATIMLKKLLNKVGIGELSNSPAKQAPDSGLVKELSSQIESLAKQVKELSNRKSPSAKAVRGPSHNDSKTVEKQLFGHEASEGVQQMSAILKQFSR